MTLIFFKVTTSHKFYAKHDDLPGRVNGLYVTILKNLVRKCANEADTIFASFQGHYRFPNDEV